MKYSCKLVSKNSYAKFRPDMFISMTLHCVSIDFSLTVKAATLIFISKRGSAISSAKEGKSGSIYNV